ncbi:hypothetical protein [Kitasatospora sp. NPDC051914]|uniref:hypothetical protein n=1 Tax=Kitasatospora sp. NPDC051914 TaxID=3154945 RepID=UPI00343DF3E7
MIWGLTDLGLDAAASTLPSERKIGGRARSVGRTTGAPHAMAVNDTIVAMTSPATPGTPIGTIADWTTEAAHPCRAIAPSTPTRSSPRPPTASRCSWSRSTSTTRRRSSSPPSSTGTRSTSR